MKMRLLFTMSSLFFIKSKMDYTKVIKECPRFKSCSVNLCPLDLNIDLRNRLKGESSCRVSKNIRVKIAKRFGLKNLGLTKLELAAKKRFEKMSPEKRERFAKEGARKLKKQIIV